MNVYQLFVYGSLRSGFQHPAYEYISRYFTLIGPGRVRGQLFDMGDYPAGVPSAKDQFIQGELYVIKNEREFAWALCQLDDYEGVLPEPHETALFRRELTEVMINDAVTTAWIYWFNGDVSGRQPVPSGDVMQWRNQSSKQ